MRQRALREHNYLFVDWQVDCVRHVELKLYKSLPLKCYNQSLFSAASTRVLLLSGLPFTHVSSVQKVQLPARLTLASVQHLCLDKQDKHTSRLNGLAKPMPFDAEKYSAQNTMYVEVDFL
jgi:hypothetical protein